MLTIVGKDNLWEFSSSLSALRICWLALFKTQKSLKPSCTTANFLFNKSARSRAKLKNFCHFMHHGDKKPVNLQLPILHPFKINFYCRNIAKRIRSTACICPWEMDIIYILFQPQVS